MGSMLKFLLAAAAFSLVSGLDNGFPLPQLGWNSWNHYGCGVTEDVVKAMADAFVDNGMAKAGYEYVNVDDCWMAKNRTADGRLTADPDRFPGGMKALAGYVHSKGLKFGLYSARCGKTCQGRPGSQDHEWLDAQTFASWDVDYLKYDNCMECKYGYESTAFIMQVTRMGDAIRATGRKIFYSTEMGGQVFNADVCNSAREGSDISPSWERILYELDAGARYANMAGPGYHNDFDMLEVGNGNLTPDEDKAHFALWCLMSSPLLAGNNLTSASKDVVSILTSRGPLSVNQDALGLQGTMCSNGTDGKGGWWQAWSKPLADGGTAVVLLNRNTTAPVQTTLPFAACANASKAASMEVVDLWTGQALGTSAGSFTATIDPHAHRMVKLVPKKDE